MVKRDNARVSGLIDDVELLFLECIPQTGKVVEETSYRASHPFLRRIDVLDVDSLVRFLLVGMVMRGINRNVVPALGQSHRYIFGKLLKAAVVVGDAPCSYKCYLHVLNAML